MLILKDLQEIFDFVEPSDKNQECYSYRIHALLLRSCVEVEANCKAIMKENGYNKSGNWNMDDYKKIDKTHFLSAYEIKVPNWVGENSIRMPFMPWSEDKSLSWYQAYNATKHDRHLKFEKATFEHLIDSCCAVLILLSAQFGTNDFSPRAGSLMLEGSYDQMESGIGGFFRVKFPNDIPHEDRYDFNWQELRNCPDPFQELDYQNM